MTYFANNHKFNSSKGFTLIELLVVVAIIGVLASIVLVSLSSANAKGRDSKRLSEIKQTISALELYFNEFGYYPQFTTLTTRCNIDTEISNSLDSLVSSNFLPKVPVDPKNNNSPNPRLCYEYIGIGNASNYPSTSSWYCSGRPRTDYQYVIHFSTETNIKTNYSILTNSSGVPNNEYTYCVIGPLR